MGIIDGSGLSEDEPGNDWQLSSHGLLTPDVIETCGRGIYEAALLANVVLHQELGVDTVAAREAQDYTLDMIARAANVMPDALLAAADQYWEVHQQQLPQLLSILDSDSTQKQ